MGAERVFIARCPEHGLHGARAKCFVCGGPVEQVPMVAEAELARLRDLLSEGVAAWERVDIMLRAAGFEAIDRDEAVARLIGQRDNARAAPIAAPNPKGGIVTDHEPRTTFVEVASELLAQAGGEWSEPVRFRFKQLPSGMVELIFQTVATDGERYDHGQIACALDEALSEAWGDPRTDVWRSFWDRLTDGDAIPQRRKREEPS